MKLIGGNYKPNNSDFYVKLDNGSEIWIGGLDDKDRTEKILGLEFATMYFNEASQISFMSFDMSRSRLAQLVMTIKGEELRTKYYFDCNPPSKKHWLHDMFVKKIDPKTKVKHKRPTQYQTIKMNPIDNTENIANDYLENLDDLTGKNRKRFKDGDWTDDNEAALWKREWIDNNRVYKMPDFKKCGVALDPSASSNENSDECGIISGGSAYINGVEHFYVYSDKTAVLSPDKWADIALMEYDKIQGDKIIGERNNGGDMIETIIRAKRQNISYKGVWASRGKETRAEPIASLYEQNRVHHIGDFPELEDELTEWNPTTDKSPNRLDAVVWLITWLSGIKKKGRRTYNIYD
jgi:phage terminase large subunit-like protein